MIRKLTSISPPAENAPVFVAFASESFDLKSALKFSALPLNVLFFAFLAIEAFVCASSSFSADFIFVFAP
ncbi:MAG: hypothetical protein IPQ02_10125 [Saprospiraceae bacterium]|nr:hypothetical protein [Candidatus Defluviibacterium haderslevense]